MKLIIAYIRPEKLEDVQAELEKADVHRLSVSKVKGCGQQGGFTESYRGVKEKVELVSKVRIEMAVNDSFVEKAISAVSKGAKTEKAGDGKIFVLPLEDCIRIRSGERGIAAIGGDSKEVEKEKSLAFSKSIGKGKR